jgi:putative peptidoglycan lipid II flippase
VHRLVRLSGWTIGYVVTNQIALAFILWLTPDKGSALTQYQSAFIFFQLPHGLIAVSIMTAIVPEFARAANAGDFDALRRHFGTGLRWLLLAITPAAAGYLVLARPIIETVVGHGRFNTEAAVSGTAHALEGFAIGLVAFSVYLYTLRVYYAQGNTRTPFFVNAAENALNIVAAAVLFPIWGVGGLGLAYSIAYAVTAVVTLVVLHRRMGGILDADIAWTFARALVAAAAAALAAWCTVRVVGGSPFGLAVACGVGVAVYLAGLLGLREPSVFALIVAIRRRWAAKV